MKTKSLIYYALISSIFLFSLVSIWKILVTLQGVKLKNFNFGIIISLGIAISLLNLIIGEKLNYLIKSTIFALIFTFVDGYIVQVMPIWYNIGIFAILIFFTIKINKYNQKYYTYKTEKKIPGPNTPSGSCGPGADPRVYWATLKFEWPPSKKNTLRIESS